jgi:hypothetical protein
LTSAYISEQETLVPGAYLDVSLEEGTGDDEMLDFDSLPSLAQKPLTKADTNGQNTSSKTERRQHTASCSSRLEHGMKCLEKPIY